MFVIVLLSHFTTRRALIAQFTGANSLGAILQVKTTSDSKA